MTPLIAFKTVQFAVVLTYAAFISDFRNKGRMAPLIDERFILSIKACYLLPIAVHAYSLLLLDGLLAFDFVALGLSGLGTLIVVRAKSDLGAYHTWAGYHADTPKVVTTGVYAFVRHPLYVGIYMFGLGILATVIPHAPWCLTAIALAGEAYAGVFLAAVAVREDRLMAERCGQEFLEYRRQVHAFLPIRTYRR